MRSLLRKLGRLLRLAAVTSIVIGIVRAVTGKKRQDVTGEASWPPLADDTKASPTAPTPAAESAESKPQPVATPVATEASWVEPTDGECPVSHPIKGNAQSKIFHVPEGMSYGRTTAERCYATAEAAEADGFRQAKR
jgi:hypothetical protein